MWSLFRLAARSSLAAIFVSGGYEVFLHPEGPAKRADERVPLDPPDLELIARAQGGVQVAGGLLLAAGIAPRVAAGVLALTLFPVTYVGHPFWSVEDPQQRRQQRIHFFKNVGLFGGLLYVVTSKH